MVKEIKSRRTRKGNSYQMSIHLYASHTECVYVYVIPDRLTAERKQIHRNMNNDERE